MQSTSNQESKTSLTLNFWSESKAEGRFGSSAEAWMFSVCTAAAACGRQPVWLTAHRELLFVTSVHSGWQATRSSSPQSALSSSLCTYFVKQMFKCGSYFYCSHLMKQLLSPTDNGVGDCGHRSRAYWGSWLRHIYCAVCNCLSWMCVCFRAESSCVGKLGKGGKRKRRVQKDDLR